MQQVQRIEKHVLPVFDSCDGGKKLRMCGTDHFIPVIMFLCGLGLYVGGVGVGYMFYQLAMNSGFEDEKSDLLKKARSYVDVSRRYCEEGKARDPPSSFILGEAGILVVSALVYAEMGE